MTFEEYLTSKKIDSGIFQQNEPALWELWKQEFEQMHPNSFTTQKLYLINPLRRKYPGKVLPKETAEGSSADKEVPAPKPVSTVAKPRPLFKPKPKT